jgi:hypothetical protein
MNALRVDRHWLLTSTTYGTWLPGDPRGFVSNVADGPGPEVRHNIPGTPYDKDMPGLVRVARENLKFLRSISNLSKRRKFSIALPRPPQFATGCFAPSAS